MSFISEAGGRLLSRVRHEQSWVFESWRQVHGGGRTVLFGVLVWLPKDELVHIPDFLFYTFPVHLLLYT